MITSLKSAVVSEGFVFEVNPMPSCHASTLAETEHGLVAAWFGGKRECFPDVGIWLSRRDPLTFEWSTPVEVANGIQHVCEDGTVLRYACWNPVLFQPRATAVDPHPALVLFYKVGKNPQDWWGVMTTSKDGGLTWSPQRRLPEGICGPVKNKPIQTENGDWLCPASTEESLFTGWCIHFERTTDQGLTWSRTGPVNDGVEFGAIQPSILCHEKPEGGNYLQAVGRTQLAKRIFSTTSHDDGHTWSEISFLDIPNPDSGTDAVTMSDGRHALIYNPTEDVRWPLSLGISSDGITWERVFDLETEPGEYSYPAIIQTVDGNLHVSYTWKRKRIKHVVIDPSKLCVKMDSGAC